MHPAFGCAGRAAALGPGVFERSGIDHLIIAPGA
jgi:hypothetical protein